MSGHRLTYAELENERERLAAERARAEQALRNMDRTSLGRPRRVVAHILHDKIAALDAAWAAVDRELYERADEAPRCVVCGDINVCRGGDLCHSCHRDLGVRRAADVEARAA